KIHIPYYVCPVIWQSLRQENVQIAFYHIDKFFMPEKKFEKEDYILYINYFGLCGKQSKILANKYKNLILDNAHAFFAENLGLASFSSPRKFFNVNDGGILNCEKELNYELQQDENRNIKIFDFNSFCKNELSIDNQPLKKISNITYKKLLEINFEDEAIKKKNIFNQIRNIFKNINEYEIKITDEDIPMIYPLISKHNEFIANFLSKNGIYTLKYWSELPNNFTESLFQNKMLAIPIIKKSSEICSFLSF
ncbi:hypothetical protein IJG14_01735, partial [bacterium]|nr:hypothetical protein [bacterium]